MSLFLFSFLFPFVLFFSLFPLLFNNDIYNKKGKGTSKKKLWVQRDEMAKTRRGFWILTWRCCRVPGSIYYSLLPFLFLFPFRKLKIKNNKKKAVPHDGAGK
jgi:hypothetical protein